jgi:hypothetical protein
LLNLGPVSSSRFPAVLFSRRVDITAHEQSHLSSHGQQCDGLIIIDESRRDDQTSRPWNSKELISRVRVVQQDITLGGYGQNAAAIVTQCNTPDRVFMDSATPSH